MLRSNTCGTPSTMLSPTMTSSMNLSTITIMLSVIGAQLLMVSYKVITFFPYKKATRCLLVCTCLLHRISITTLLWSCLYVQRRFKTILEERTSPFLNKIYGQTLRQTLKITYRQTQTLKELRYYEKCSINGRSGVNTLIIKRLCFFRWWPINMLTKLFFVNLNYLQFTPITRRLFN